MNKPKVTLVSYSNNPVETLFYLWEASRSNEPIPSVYDIERRSRVDKEYKAKVRKTFEMVVDSAIPIAENIWFVFLLENVSVSFREQMVRHRIGVKFGDQLGVDLVPELGSSTWWSQSMRVLNMGKFASEQKYRIPESVKGTSFEFMYHEQMEMLEGTYNDMIEGGIPVEDARDILPLATQHRISWGINLGSLCHILKKRGCWILQLGLWEPIIRGIVEELSTKVDRYFRTLIQPPCVKGDAYTGCTVKLDNEKRIKKEDPLPPCSLYLHKEGGLRLPEEPFLELYDAEVETAVGNSRLLKFKKMEKDYEELWGRDVHTAKRKP